MDISILKIGENSYNIKDETARTEASQASATANKASTTASQANQNSQTAINRLNATTLVATYTEEDETLALSVNTQVQS